MIDALTAAIERAKVRRRLPPPPARRLLRERAGLSQLDIATALDVTTAAVSRWETGNRTPRGGVLQRYVETLDRLARESLTS